MALVCLCLNFYLFLFFGLLHLRFFVIHLCFRHSCEYLMCLLNIFRHRNLHAVLFPAAISVIFGSSPISRMYVLPTDEEILLLIVFLRKNHSSTSGCSRAQLIQVVLYKSDIYMFLVRNARHFRRKCLVEYYKVWTSVKHVR